MSQISCDSPSLGVKLMSVDEALSALAAVVVPIKDSELVTLGNGLQRVLADNIYSPIDVPSLANSAMDGYALNAADFSVDSSASLRVSQRIPAGSVGESLEVGTVARIFTGAPIPNGADTVVMQELCTASDCGEYVAINDDVQLGQNVRKAGEDIETGACVLETGCCLSPQDLGLLASIGCSEIRVIKKLRVAVLFTGDELKQPGETLNVGQIYNSNQYVLVGLLERIGCEVINLGIVEDTLPSTIDALSHAASSADLIVTSGGVSVGEEDHIKSAVSALGEMGLWRIAIKPGKPLAFGHVNHVPFLGLPGNPVSVFVTACIFARPYIHAMQGLGFDKVKGVRVCAGFSLSYTARREEYLRVRLDFTEKGEARLVLYPHQGSGVLTSASWAMGLAVVKQGETVVVGDMVEYISFGDFGI